MPRGCELCGSDLDAAEVCTNLKCPNAARVEKRGRPPLPRVEVRRRLKGSGVEFGALMAIDLAALLVGFFLGVGVGALITGFVTGVVLLAYMIVRDLNGGRYSFGKRWVKMKVVDVKTLEPASNGQSVMRNITYILALLGVFLDPVYVIGWGIVLALIAVDLVMIWRSPQGRRLGDLIAGTQVVPLQDYRRD
jgi:uncharacterized RDD family membrane protein YckC